MVIIAFSERLDHFKIKEISLKALIKYEDEIRKKRQEFLNKFILIKELGVGGFGEVWLAHYKNSFKLCAIKFIRKTNEFFVYNKEINIMKKCKNKSKLCQLYENYEDEFKLIIVMEYIAGKELYDYINIKLYPEDIIKNIFIQILQGIQEMHEADLVHRDIKPENIIIENIEDNLNLNVTILDFGLAEYCNNTTILTRKCGSLEYMAPEVKKEKYNKSSDIYSLGILLYIMLCGENPFYNNSSKLKHNICPFTEPNWKIISDEAKVLVIKLLTIDPNKRIKIDNIFKHPWITGNTKINYYKRHNSSILYNNTKPPIYKIRKYNSYYNLRDIYKLYMDCI